MVERKVSIVMRTIGKSDIDNAIFSVYCNLYREKEIIVVYQGEDLSFVDYIEKCFKRYPGLEYKIIHNQDISSDQRAKNLNLGLKEATGRYICFLDDDDELCPNHLQDLILAVKESGKVWAVGQYCVKLIDDNYTQKIKTIKKINNAFLELFYFQNIIPIHAYVFDRLALKSLNIEPKFDEKIAILEDYLFILQTFIKNNLTPRVIKKPVANYIMIKNKTYGFRVRMILKSQSQYLIDLAKKNLYTYEYIYKHINGMLKKRKIIELFLIVAWKTRIMIVKRISEGKIKFDVSMAKTLIYLVYSVNKVIILKISSVFIRLYPQILGKCGFKIFT